MKLPLLLFAALVCFLAAFAVADGDERQLLLNTAWLGGLVELVALPISFALAFVLARTNAVGRGLSLVLIASLLFIPLYLQMAGWDAAFGRLGWHTLTLGTLREPWLSGWRGAVVVHSLYAIPWATLLMFAAFRSGLREWEEAALLDASASAAWRRVTWPQLQSGVCLAALWIFVLTAGEMTVTNIYMVHTYSEDVYNFFQMNADLESAVIHQVPLLLFTASLALLGLAALWQLPTESPERAYEWKLPTLRWPIGLLALVFITLLIAAPLANQVERLTSQVVKVDDQLVRTWSLGKGLTILRLAPFRFADDLQTTLVLATSVAAISVVVGATLAWSSARRPLPSALLWFASAFAIALPAPVVGLIVIEIFNRPALDAIYQSPAAPGLAILIRTLPLAFLALWLGVRSLDREMLAAAAIDGAGSLRRFTAMFLPQRWPLVAVTLLATFVLASGDLSASILTLPAGYSMITYHLFQLIHSGVDDQVAAIGLLMWLTYLPLAGLGMWLLRWQAQQAA